jgi:tellurite resistance protein TehA-like permease
MTQPGCAAVVPLARDVATGALLLMQLPCRFYLNSKYSMGEWAVGFTMAALTLGAITHHSMAGPKSHLTKVVAYIGLSITAVANVLNFSHFLRDLATYKVFTHWKPPTALGFVRLTHEALRCAPVAASAALL